MRSDNPLPRAPRSAVVPFIPGEDPSDRHQRRKRSAQEMREHLLDILGPELTLRELNNGGHWQVIGLKFLAEWWPETGRVVFNRQYQRPGKCHDVYQFAERVLGKWRNRKRGSKS